MLERIRLENFKAFGRADIPLTQLTLLSGLNGSGKSTALQALALLRQSSDSGFLDAGDLGLNGELVELGTGADVLNHSFDEPTIAISLRERDDAVSQEFIWAAPVSPNEDVLTCNIAPNVSHWKTLSLFQGGFQFLRADRITPSVTYPKSQNAVRHHRFLGAKGEYTAHYLLEFGADAVSPELLHPVANTAPSLLSQVNAWLQDFSPGVRVEPNPVPMTDFVRLAFSYKGEGVSYGEPLRPTNVGFGLTHALPVVTACLGAAPGTLLTVENPEAQLHPRGQAAIGHLLALTAASGVQVIVETHSDHVLNGIRLAVKALRLNAAHATFHFFQRRPGHESMFETPQISQDGRLSYWPSGFFDQWEKNLDELLD